MIILMIYEIKWEFENDPKTKDKNKLKPNIGNECWQNLK